MREPRPRGARDRAHPGPRTSGDGACANFGHGARRIAHAPGPRTSDGRACANPGHAPRRIAHTPGPRTSGDGACANFGHGARRIAHTPGPAHFRSRGVRELRPRGARDRAHPRAGALPVAGRARTPATRRSKSRTPPGRRTSGRGACTNSGHAPLEIAHTPAPHPRPVLAPGGRRARVRAPRPTAGRRSDVLEPAPPAPSGRDVAHTTRRASGAPAPARVRAPSADRDPAPRRPGSRRGPRAPGRTPRPCRDSSSPAGPWDRPAPCAPPRRSSSGSPIPRAGWGRGGGVRRPIPAATALAHACKNRRSPVHSGGA